MNKNANLKRDIRRARTKLRGLDGLVLAIIGTAALDVAGSDIRYKESALKYFNSSEYLLHLDYLGLPIDWLPTALES